MALFNSLATAAGLSRPKKKFRFDVSFILEDLINCTYVTGVIFAKVRLREGGTFSDVSRRCDVKNHCVKWNEEFKFPCKMYASPVTGELEPCYCKVSIRKESKGGRSYKKLGYVKINLAEYAGAGETQRRYLLDSYNENKHKPDNSILQLTISLKQTCGDSLFKVPQVKESMWELTETAEDEGIQQDIQSQPSLQTSQGSTLTSLHAFQIEGVTTSGGGGSLQDVRQRAAAAASGEGPHQRKTSSAINLRKLDTVVKSGAMPTLLGPHSSEPLSKVNPDPQGTGRKTRFDPPNIKVNRSSSLSREDTPRNNGRPDLPPSGLSHQHRRLGSLGSWSQANFSNPSPHNTHRRQQSLVSGQSSNSTSAYSTLSERSGGSAESTAEVESISRNLRMRLSLLPTSSRVEESRVDPQSVIDNLFHGHNFSSQDQSESANEECGLKIYLDKNLGTVTLGDSNLNRKHTNLQAIDVNEHKLTSSPKRRHNKYRHSLSRETSPSSQLEYSLPPHTSPPPQQPSSSSEELTPKTNSRHSSSSSSSATSVKTVKAT